MGSNEETFEASYAINTPKDVNETVVKQCLPIDLFQSYEVDSKRKMVGITSGVAPSDIISAFQKYGMDAILRGSGKPNSSAVTILEDFSQQVGSTVEGLVRIVQVTDSKTLFDITINGADLPAGNYSVAINENGDISKGLQSTGNAFFKFPETLKCLKQADGIVTGHAFWSGSMKAWEIIGRSIVLKELTTDGPGKEIGGVIARSAGAWENDKQVCACTGKTVWQERKDAREQNIN
ncbi:similar to Saccharomyces cerevisiae YMR038C CCS1 Copper chaperone for superoxide dismutase Sod1p, involved in oxidative stress protection [Maudiozyma barnettii]|uniref:Similar to Saccharomyces cerevisiae YMR038C CCS1 Copper chaperone for superoxide dismutase Sod1p, involved in oxidative stress protection n=1 Tax=Maudiozyma barnettii TaxID=61262 RepID=A0A8H2VJN2_9SACH|nr:copper chaperone CCS1 [Kazachstania barnettii]CAB4256924.1 similar to Saccharomyces cerevisiae YMR038C CCS1 Copper chaperone for superoxide dismutase Sod1p, involved in oxidative stress protection [Kazachstania barnettii]CAD1785529.1 similar to Saccharomyces cerevisiae YMR038C CCS1 Copper chaperone for superoxide dismutase Sod1p, involved in oxidative stress protection [Kazachstania barnettii]